MKRYNIFFALSLVSMLIILSCNDDDSSNEPAPPDPQNPGIEITINRPSVGATVSDTVNIKATVIHARALRTIKIFIDNTPVTGFKTETTGISPRPLETKITYTLDAKTLTKGSHLLKIFAEIDDNAGNIKATEVINFSVENTTEPEPDPETNPFIEITIDKPAANEVVSGIVNFQATVIHNKTLNALQMVMDNVWLVDAKEETTNDGTKQLKTKITYAWNSAAVADGPHQLKIFAGINDLTSTKEITFTVKNDLLVELSVPQLYIPGSGSALWIFAADETGAIIDVTQLENGQKAVLKKNGFNGNSFSLTAFRYNDNGSGDDDGVFYTVTEFKAGKYALVAGGNQAYRGAFALTLTGVPAEVSPTAFLCVSPALITAPTVTVIEDELLFTALMHNTFAPFILSYKDNENYKYLTGEVISAQNSTRSISEMEYMVSQKVAVSIGDNVAVNLSGNNTRGYYPGYLSYNATVAANQITLHYPPNVFQSLTTTLTVTEGDLTLSHVAYKAATLPAEMKYINGSITGSSFTANQCMVSIEGTCDYTEAVKQLTKDNFSERWIVALKANTPRTLPQIPAVLKEKYPVLSDYSALNPQDLYIYDYAGLNNYDDYANNPFSAYLGIGTQPKGDMTSARKMLK